MSERPTVHLAAAGQQAALQYGLITGAQAKGLGLSKDAIHRLVSLGIWSRLRPNVFALWTPRSPQERWRRRLMAGVLWLGEGSAVSHRAAVVLWGFDGIRSAPVEVSTPRRQRARGSGFIVHRTAALASDEISLLDGIPVTRPARTLLDVASQVSPRTLELILESALRSGETTLRELEDCLMRARPNLAGSRALRRLLAAHPSIPTESELESRVWQILVAAGPPIPVRQHDVLDAQGMRVASLDFAYVELRLAVEADGYRFHWNPRDFRRDRNRQNALSRLRWATHHILWEDALQRPGAVAAEVKERIQLRALEIGIPIAVDR